MTQVDKMPKPCKSQLSELQLRLGNAMRCGSWTKIDQSEEAAKRGEAVAHPHIFEAEVARFWDELCRRINSCWYELCLRSEIAKRHRLIRISIQMGCDRKSALPLASGFLLWQEYQRCAQLSRLSHPLRHETSSLPLELHDWPTHQLRTIN